MYEKEPETYAWGKTCARMNTTNCIVLFQPTISALHFRKKQKPTNFGAYFAIMLAQYTLENLQNKICHACTQWKGGYPTNNFHYFF